MEMKRVDALLEMLMVILFRLFVPGFTKFNHPKEKMRRTNLTSQTTIIT
jgi:hypothetical protein